jgi:hypothetical protein
LLNILGNTLLNKTKDIGVNAGNPQKKPFVATGGVIQNFQSGSVVFTSHTFTSSGVFTIVDGETNANVLVVGGGGGGRSGSLAGVGGEGGGAGGYVNSGSYFFTKNLLGPSTFIAQVGAGGAQNQNGVSSSFVSTYGYEEIVPIYALGGGAGSGSGGSGGGEGFTLDINQGNNGGFRIPTSAPNTFASGSARYSAPGGGSYLSTGSGATYNGHNYWRLSVISGSTPIMTSIYFTAGYQNTSSLGNVFQTWANPPTPYGSGYPVPPCADFPGASWPIMETCNNCALICGGILTSATTSSNWPIEYYNATPIAIDNIIFRAPYDSGNNVYNCEGGVQGDNGGNVLLLQYRDNITGSWINKMTGTFNASQDYWVDYGPNMLGPGPVDCKPLHKNGSFLMTSQSWQEGGNIAGAAGQSIANTWIDGVNQNWYSGGGGAGAWSGVTSGSAYIQDENATAALNAGTGGELYSLNGTNAVANSGCGGGGGAVNDSASLRGTGGSGGSGIVVITYLSGSAL